MELIRYLSVGSSLRGSGVEPDRYRETGKGWIPDFTHGAKPVFSSTIEMPLARTETRPQPQDGLFLDAPGHPAGGARRMAPDAMGHVPRSSTSGETGGSGVHAGARPASPPRRSGRVEQSELLLGQVRVVRNELTEEDLELIAARPLAPVPVREPSVPVPPLESRVSKPVSLRGWCTPLLSVLGGIRGRVFVRASGRKP